MHQKLIAEDIGKRIIQLRKERGLSRLQVAGLADISEKSLYEIEKGKSRFSINLLINLTDALKVSSDYILYGKTKSINDQNLARIIGKYEPENLAKVIRLLEVIYNEH